MIKQKYQGKKTDGIKYNQGIPCGYVAAQYINVITDKQTNVDNENKDNNQEANNNENNQETPENQNTANTNKKTVTVLKAEEKIYITPIINSLIISTLEEEKQIETISEVNGWSYVQVGTLSGWVRTENIQKKEIEDNTSNAEKNNNTSSQNVGYISGTSVNFRKTPNTSGEIISKLSRNTKVKIIAKGDTWTEVEVNGNTGYVSNDYISDKKQETTSRSSGPRNTENKNTSKTNKSVEVESTETVVGGTGADVVEYAKKYLGYRYTSGGSKPSSGFDCSGFTTYVYKHFGISLSRTSSGQSKNGTAVSKDKLQLGDIICFSGSSGSKSIGHVGIYVGGGKFIHSANSRQGVIISNVSGDGYYFVTARRVI